jgi:excisionase family DNA binding protein
MTAVRTTRTDERHVPKLLLTPEEAAGALGVGRTTLYGLLRTGAVASVRIGGSRRVPTSAVEEYVRTLTTPGADQARERHLAGRSPTPASAGHIVGRSRRNRRKGAATTQQLASAADPGSPTVEVVPLPFAAGQAE